MYAPGRCYLVPLFYSGGYTVREHRVCWLQEWLQMSQDKSVHAWGCFVDRTYQVCSLLHCILGISCVGDATHLGVRATHNRP